MQELSVDVALRSLKPERVTLIITQDKKHGRHNLMPACWFTRVSFEPPLVMVSIGKTRYTHELLKNSKYFVIAVPSKKLEHAVRVAGSCSGRNVDKFAELNLEIVEGNITGLPLLADAAYNFECEKQKAVDAGDHTLFIAKVLAAYQGKGKILFATGRGFEELE